MISHSIRIIIPGIIWALVGIDFLFLINFSSWTCRLDANNCGERDKEQFRDVVPWSWVYRQGELACACAFACHADSGGE